MKRSKQFPFKKARRITSSEVEENRKAIERMSGITRPRRLGRPPKASRERYIPLSIRLHPQVFAWIKREAKRREIPYQSLINQILLNVAA